MSLYKSEEFRSSLLSFKKNPDSIVVEDKTNNFFIINPRYSLIANLKPNEIILALKNEKERNIITNVFDHFIVSAPPLPNSTAAELRETSNLKYVKIQSILYLITIIHQNFRRKYSFSPETIILFSEYFDKIQKQRVLLFDPYLK